MCYSRPFHDVSGSVCTVNDRDREGGLLRPFLPLVFHRPCRPDRPVSPSDSLSKFSRSLSGISEDVFQCRRIDLSLFPSERKYIRRDDDCLETLILPLPPDPDRKRGTVLESLEHETNRRSDLLSLKTPLPVKTLRHTRKEDFFKFSLRIECTVRPFTL